MTLKVKVNDLHFHTSWECPRMHVWYKFGDSSSNLWRVIVRTSKSLWTDGQTQATTIPFWPERPRGTNACIPLKFGGWFSSTAAETLAKFQSKGQFLHPISCLWGFMRSNDVLFDTKLAPFDLISGLILGLHPANERRCYKVTLSLIGWVQT